MSHANAEFIFKDNTVLHGEYNGTSDVMLTNMFTTYDEMTDHWREQEWKECECDGEPCIAFTDYGSGSWWVGCACREHMVYKKPRMIYEDDRLWVQVGESKRNKVKLVYNCDTGENYHRHGVWPTNNLEWRVMAKKVLDGATLENMFMIPDVELEKWRY